MVMGAAKTQLKETSNFRSIALDATRGQRKGARPVHRMDQIGADSPKRRAAGEKEGRV